MDQQEEISLIPDSELFSIVLENETKVMILANVENKDYWLIIFQVGHTAVRATNEKEKMKVTRQC